MFGGPTTSPRQTSGLACQFAVLDFRFDVIAIHKRNEIKTDFLRAGFMALTVVRACPKERLHCFDHIFGTFETLGLPLGNEIQVRQFRRGE